MERGAHSQSIPVLGAEPAAVCTSITTYLQCLSYRTLCSDMGPGRREGSRQSHLRGLVEWDSGVGFTSRGRKSRADTTPRTRYSVLTCRITSRVNSTHALVSDSDVCHF
jgi:hypothetical protein